MDAAAAYGAPVIAGVPDEGRGRVSEIHQWIAIIYRVTVSHCATKLPLRMGVCCRYNSMGKAK